VLASGIVGFVAAVGSLQVRALPPVAAASRIGPDIAVGHEWSLAGGAQHHWQIDRNISLGLTRAPEARYVALLYR
jgi:hypothetical protein